MHKLRYQRVKLGDRFGRLAVIGFLEGKRSPTAYPIVQCDCGSNAYATQHSNLQSGNTSSCGCAKLLHTNLGAVQRLWYLRWHAMHDRCNDPTRYGARGITVCKRWHSFAKFAEDIMKLKGWDKPVGLEMDRIDGKGPYAPWNVRLVSEHFNRSRRDQERSIEEWKRAWAEHLA